VQTDVAVEQVLDSVIGGVADVGLGVDEQPWLPLGGKYVAGMQVGAQQHLVFRVERQLPE